MKRTLPMLLAGLLIILMSTPAIAQKAQVTKSASPGGTCDFGQPSYGARCEHDSGTLGSLGSFLGGNTVGAYGQHNNGNIGALGGSFFSALGQNVNANFGYLGHNSYGAYGQNVNANFGYLGSSSYGAYGQHFSGTQGYLGGSILGALGQHNNGNFGALGGSFYGTQGRNANDNQGYLGHNSYGVYGQGTPWAGYFDGNVEVTGTLTNSSAAFKIDHPLDPEGQYLVHSAIESPDMMNVYNGNVMLDAAGEAVVALPEYFEVLNRDFRYQLTAIGAPGPNLYIAEKISGNQFKIAGGKPGMEVSWQVTGIRKDPWAEQNRIVVEEAKPAVEQGFYLHPGLYDQPAERSVEWARDPEGMREIQEMPARMEEERQRMEEERQQIQEERQGLREARSQQ